jgi:hypothetical protein
LLDCGMAGAVDIDASTAYVAAATQEAERLGHSHRIQFVHADFVTASSQLAAADVVTLDRVVCCYPSFDALLNAALDRARAFVALSYPRDVWFVRVGNVFENGVRRLKNNPFRTFVHSAQGMRALIWRAGFDLEHRHETWTWCVEIYARKRGMK